MRPRETHAGSGLARVEDAVTRVLQVLVGAIMIGAVLINFANVIARYLFSRPFIWAEETMQFLSVWAVMLGAAVITRNGAHLKMDALQNTVFRRGCRMRRFGRTPLSRLRIADALA